ncbi:MAG: hypothetical protein ACP5M4_01030 [Acidobacteriaceae bacterium]
MAECRRRPGLLARELAWRWLYGIPALAAVGAACYHIYQVTADTLQSAGTSRISLAHPWQGAAVVSVVAGLVGPVVTRIALWLLPLLGLGWAIAAGVGRNLVLRGYDAELPWRPAAMTVIQSLRVLALAATLALWWGGLRWSAQVSTVAGVPDIPVYFGLVTALTIGVLVLWSLCSWVFFMAPLFLLIEQRSLAGSLGRAIRPGSARGRLVGANAVVALLRFVAAAVFTVLSLLPLGLITAPHSLLLWLWLAGMTVAYMALSSFFQVVRLVAFVAFWGPEAAAQNPVSQRYSNHVN